jgi:hypothetical protein
MYRLTVSGSVDGDIIHANIYPEGSKTPILELYLSDDTNVINVAVLYSAMRSSLAGQNRLLGALLPVWEENGYVTFEQAEELLDADLGALKDFKLQFSGQKISVGQLFLLLASMDANKKDNSVTFQKSLGNDKIVFKLNYENVPDAEIRLSAEDPAELMERLAPVLSKAGWDIGAEIPETIENLSLKVYPGQGKDLTVPDDYVNQKLIELILNAKELLQSVTDRD